jgi:nicotinamidase-related amidase
MERSGSLLSAQDSLVLMVDMQSRLVPVIAAADLLTQRLHLLLRAAQLLDVPVRATEQHTRALGATIELLAQPERAVYQKMHFSAVAEPGFIAWLAAARKRIVITGVEAHICVLQSAIDMVGAGYRVAVVADAVGSRNDRDRDRALDRMAREGVSIVTAEMVIFEWLQQAAHPRFREVLQLVK